MRVVAKLLRTETFPLWQMFSLNIEASEHVQVSHHFGLASNVIRCILHRGDSSEAPCLAVPK